MPLFSIFFLLLKSLLQIKGNSNPFIPFSPNNTFFSRSHLTHTVPLGLPSCPTLSSVVGPPFFIRALLALLIETFRLARTLMNRILPGWRHRSTTRPLRGGRTNNAIRVPSFISGRLLDDATADGLPLSTNRRREKMHYPEDNADC